MRSPWVIVALTAAVASAQTRSVSSIPKDMEGGGRACYGHFIHTASRLSWRATYTSCSSPFTVNEHKDLHWVLKVNRSKTCAYEAIEVLGVIPSDANQGMWSVVGYSRMSDIGKPGAEALGCGMLPTEAKEKTPAKAIK